MSTNSFSIENLIKIQAKFFAKAKNIPLNQAYNELAIKNHFENYHEVVKVLNKNRNDPRIHKLAFQYDYGFDDLILEHTVASGIESFLEETFSSDIASMNAYNFSFEYNEVNYINYDENTGFLYLDVDLDYSGTPDFDNVYNGHIIYALIRVALTRNKNGWQLNQERSCVLSFNIGTEEPNKYDFIY